MSTAVRTRFVFARIDAPSATLVHAVTGGRVYWRHGQVSSIYLDLLCGRATPNGVTPIYGLGVDVVTCRSCRQLLGYDDPISRAAS